MNSTINDKHDHVHGAGCGHTAIRHGDHVDFLHDGHLHHAESGQVDEHALPVDSRNPAGCTPDHGCRAHDEGHQHGPGCGHEPVPHGDHTDYMVAGHLHHPCTGHCDDHGALLAA